MAGIVRKAMIKAYDERGRTEPKLFLSSFFGGEHKFDTESVEFDVQRSGRSVAVDVQFGADGNLNEMGIYSNKELTPPMYDEYVAVDAFTGFKRLPGEMPYSSDRSHWARAIGRMVSGQIECRRKILRAIEFQARQILFGGAKVHLRYPLKGSLTIDFKANPDLHMVAPASWTDPKTDIIGQVEDLAKRVDVLGKGRPKALLLSEMAWKYLGENETFNKRLDQRRRTEGSVVMPKFNDRGAAYVGTFTFGPYELEMWVYPEVFDAPYDLPGEGIPAGRTAPWVPINKVAVVNPHARRDKLFGGVPIHLKLNPEDASDLDIPSVPVPAAYDFRPYTRLEGWAVHAGVMSRPLLAPIEIDSWGTLEVFPVTEDSSPEVTTSATKEKATKKAA